MKHAAIVIASLLLFFKSPSVLASCGGILPAINSATLSGGTCTISATDGVDWAKNIESSTTNTGSLTLSNGASITINATGTLVVGQLNLLSGSIAIAQGGKILPGSAIYVTDADADGWASSFSTLTTATASGRRRLSLMRSTTATDCNDISDYRLNNQCCALVTWYQDADNDTYGNPSVTKSECNQPAGYVSNNSDCYDSNAIAKPGSVTCSSTHRGDGSFDFNCNGTQSSCGTSYYNSTTKCYWEECGDKCCNQCYTVTTSAVACGSTGLGTGYCWGADSDSCGSWEAGCLAAGSGTRACQ